VNKINFAGERKLRIMKKMICIVILLLVVGIYTTNAQDNATKPESGVKKDANAVGNKTAEIASKSKAGIVDKVYKGKEGPNGETIHIDKQSKYYLIDKKGHKEYIAKSKLRTKKVVTK
jgi:hypothetical protein